MKVHIICWKFDLMAHIFITKTIFTPILNDTIHCCNDFRLPAGRTRTQMTWCFKILTETQLSVQSQHISPQKTIEQFIGVSKLLKILKQKVSYFRNKTLYAARNFWRALHAITARQNACKKEQRITGLGRANPRFVLTSFLPSRTRNIVFATLALLRRDSNRPPKYHRSFARTRTTYGCIS